jgi:hypothetical protein
MLTAPPSDPHNINTSSLLSIRYIACNTAVIYFSSLLCVSFYPLLHLILFLSSFVTLWYYYLLINRFIHVFTHYCPRSPFFLSLTTYNSSVRNSLVYLFLLVLELSLKYPAHLRYFLNSLSPCAFLSILPFRVCVFKRSSWGKPNCT